jgi:hypothetical protein
MSAQKQIISMTISTLLFNDLWTHNIDTIAFVLHEFGKEHSIWWTAPTQC